MRIKQFLLFVFTLFFLGSSNLFSQDIWQDIDQNNLQVQKRQILKQSTISTNKTSYKLLSLNQEILNNRLFNRNASKSIIIDLPNGNGGFSRYKLKEIYNIDADLAKKYPMIKSYEAYSLEDASSYATISVGLDGFHAVIFSKGKQTSYIDPYTKDRKSYVFYTREHLRHEDKDFVCLVNDDKNIELPEPSQLFKTSNEVKLKTYRLALACTGEYAQFHLDNQNIVAQASDEIKKGAVLSAMNTSINRVNQVLQRELSIKLVIVADNDKIVFLDPDSDNLTNDNAGSLIDEIQNVIDSNIGSANYDIGHVFSTGDDSGVAIFESVCETGQKARGVTGRLVPIGDAYDIDFVVHEIGHQFGATHTFNNSCSSNRTNSTAIEPGSGSTIMGYAGICSPNVQSQSDDYFHAISLTQMQNFIANRATCAVSSDTNNTAPVANAGSNYSIPKSTPFVLRGSGNDTENATSLTYNWEQINNEIAIMSPEPTNSVGPLFRSLPSKTNPNRYMPALATVVAGNTGSTWEVLPSVARNMDFSLVVRDNNAGAGAFNRDDMQVTVVDAIPFTVTSLSSNETWDVGSSQTITWEKGTTDIAPINCASVNIKLSIDGGLTFPITIKANTPNDGSETIIVPNNATENARIMVEAADNIFYNINATNFTIKSTIPTFVIENRSGTQFICNSGNQEATYTLNFDFVNGFSETTNLSATLPSGLSGGVVSFSPTSINADGNITMKISNLNGKNAQAYTINVQANSATVNQNIDVSLNITDNNFNPVTLISPTNGTTGFGLKDELQWSTDANISSYRIQIATDTSFSSVVVDETVDNTSFGIKSLRGNTTYFWRVKPKNSCGEGNFSINNTFTTGAPYCISNFTDEADGTEHITNVTFNDINNDSGNDKIDGYEDFSNVSTSVMRGETHKISVTFDTGGFRDHCYVFIDWNQDLEFNLTDERYDLGSLEDSQFGDGQTEQGTRMLDITVPEDAEFGPTGMRVIIEYFEENAPHGEGPCDIDHEYEWGETEDYTVIVDSIASVKDAAFDNFNLYPNPTKGDFTLKLKLGETKKVNLLLFDIRGRLIDEKEFLNTNTSFSEKIFFDKANSGMYFLRVINGDKQTIRKLIIY